MHPRLCFSHARRWAARGALTTVALFVLMALIAPMATARAQAASPSGDAIPIADVLAPDGTLHLPRGKFGTINLAGYQAFISPSGAPQFKPNGVAGEAPHSGVLDAPQARPLMASPGGDWASRFGIAGMNGAIGARTVTYDFARLMEGAREVSCSAFGRELVTHMERAAAGGRG